MHSRVMIVDDDAGIREALSDALSDERYTTVNAANGAEALQALRKGDVPCLIILDLMMPVMDGLTFRREQLADAALKDIPVVVLSANVAAVDLSKDRSLAAIVRKPLDLDVLLEVVQRHCGAPPAA